jgi:hypothetical protein
MLKSTKVAGRLLEWRAGGEGHKPTHQGSEDPTTTLAHCWFSPLEEYGKKGSVPNEAEKQLGSRRLGLYPVERRYILFLD